MEEALRGLLTEALVSQARFECSPSARAACIGYKEAHRRVQMVSDGLGFIPEIPCAWCPGRPDGHSPSSPSPRVHHSETGSSPRTHSAPI